MANANTNEKLILQTIIDLSGKLEGCKLEENILKTERENIGRLAKYLNIDETSTVFFTVIFYLQIQAGRVTAQIRLQRAPLYPLRWSTSLLQVSLWYEYHRRSPTGRI